MAQHERERPRRVLVVGGWSPGPLDALQARMDRVEFLEPTIPMPPSGCRWCLNPFCPLLLVVIFWLLPMVASGEWPAGIEGTMSWLVRLAALLAIPLLMRLCVAGLVWFSIKDGLWTISRAINDFQPDVILAFSWGGGLALWLLAERRWRGPALLLAPTVKAMACVACRALPRFPAPSALAPVHVFHANHDGFCPESQVAALSAAGCELHLCDDNHVLLRRQTVEEIHSCLKQLLSLSPVENCDGEDSSELSTLLHLVVYWWQLAAFLRLKLRWPDLPRLYTVPGGLPGAWLLCALKAPVLVLLVISACADWSMVVAALVVNGLLYVLVQCIKS
eukprot:s1521_g5.t1